ncbi:MAG: AAA family ATPase [Phycisphaerales bacterium]|nr:AAA family ATPase [Phycisphaerales bacterium]
MKISIPELSLVVLVGPAGAGKSTFAQRHFRPTEVLSSDFFRGLLCDDESVQEATVDAFNVLTQIVAKRLTGGRLTVIDATNVQPEDRKPLVALARKHHCVPVAIVFDLPPAECQRRIRERGVRPVPRDVIERQHGRMKESIPLLMREGFERVIRVGEESSVDAPALEREPLPSNLRHEYGPFDIIGDVHGCCTELETLLDDLGYAVESRSEGESLSAGPVYRHRERRLAVFLGDLGDRGPRILDTIRLVYNMVSRRRAICVMGNHDIKLLRRLKGHRVKQSYGFDRTVTELEALPPDVRGAFGEPLAAFLAGLPSHCVLDDGRLVVAHAGMRQELQGRSSAKVHHFALYGETTGETDEFGAPVRYNWAAEYAGAAMVVYGHTPVVEPVWQNRTLNVDTGCVFGGKLTALRYPEKEWVSVAARERYFVPDRSHQEATDQVPV